MCFVYFRPNSVGFELRLEQLGFKFHSRGKHDFLVEKKKTRRKQLLLWKNIKFVHAWALEQNVVVETRLPERNLKKLCNAVCYCRLLFSLLK